PGDVLAHRVRAFGALVGRVVVEHDVRVVERMDRVEVLRVPRSVVALDQLADIHLLRRRTLASPTRRVTPSASNRSRYSWAVFRPTPRASRNCASVIPSTSTALARSYSTGEIA